MTPALEMEAIETRGRDAGSLVSIAGLEVVFRTYMGTVHALSGIDLELHARRITGLAGETGCGKSVTAKAIMRLLPHTARAVGGSIQFDGEELLTKTDREMADIRGKRIGMIFQNARAALNPLFTIEKQLYYLLARHEHLNRSQARKRSLELLSAVRIGGAARRLKSYPFELSTGMCQRVMIAMGLACHPLLLIADEPTTGLDVTIQAQVLELFKSLVRESGSTALLITHDLGVIGETCDYLGVMYGGRMVEFGATEDLIEHTAHPYTRGLLRCSFAGEEDDAIHYIPGSVPNLLVPPSGCVFEARCDVRGAACPGTRPNMVEVSSGHLVACFKAGKGLAAQDEEGEVR